MNLGILLTGGLLVLMVALTAAFIGLMIYSDSVSPALQPAPEETTTTASSTTSTTSTSSTSVAESTSTTEAPTTTTSTMPRKTMALGYSQEKLYLHDSLDVQVSSGGNPLRDVSVYLDGRLLFPPGQEEHLLESLEGGDHTVSASAEGYYNASSNFSVATTTYSNSQEVRRRLTEGERQDAISSGKADFRFYDSPGCPNCKSVLRYLTNIIDKNRQCVIYEKLWVYDNTNELQEHFGKGVLEFPLIVVEGPRGTYKTQGIVSANALREMITSASGCGVQ